MMRRVFLFVLPVFCLLTIAVSVVGQAIQNRPVERQPGKPPVIEFLGLRNIDDSDLRKELLESGALSQKDGSTEKSIEVLRKALREQGYVDAAVSVSKFEPHAVTFLVDEGSRYRINEIRFEGNNAFSSRELSLPTLKCLEDIGDDDSYDASRLSYCLRNTANLLRSRGYMKAELGQPNVAVSGGGLVITVPVTEGIRYRLGQVKIEGARRFNAGQLRALLSVQEGDIADARALGKWLFEDLNQRYSALGYVSFTAELEPEFGQAAEGRKESRVDLKVTIEEGPQFRIQTIKFDGAGSAEQSVKSFIPLQSGDIFNRAQFLASIERLNELGLFAPIDHDRDVDYEVDDEHALIKVSVKLKPASSTTLTKSLRR